MTMKEMAAERMKIILLWTLFIIPCCAQDACRSDPCLNGGTCQTITTDVYRCVCPTGYTGDTCHTEITCRHGHFFDSHNNTCQQCPVGTYSPVFGRPPDCDDCPEDSHGHLSTTLAEGSTQLSQCIYLPSIRLLSATYGPLAGGTAVYLAITHQDSRHILDYNIAGGMCKNFQQTEESDVYVCHTSPVKRLSRGPIKLLFDDSLQAVSNTDFQYRANPIVHTVDRWKTFISGGLIMVVTGANLDSVAQPVLQVVRVAAGQPRVFHSNCTVHNSTEMSCVIPNLADGLNHILFSASRSSSRTSRDLRHRHEASRDLNSHQSRKHAIARRAVDGPTFNDQQTRFYAGFVMDGVEEFKNLSAKPQYGQLLVYPDPVYYPFYEENGVREFYSSEDEFMHIKGDHLNYACRLTDIVVTVGVEECELSFLATNQLSCRPPDRQPPVEDSGYGPGNVPRVTVYVGSLTYVIGYLKYSNRTHQQVDPVLDDALLGVIAAVSIGVPIIIVVIIVCLIKKRKGNWEKRNRLSNGSSAQSNDYYEIQRMARTSDYQVPIDYLPGYSLNPDGSFVDGRGRQMSTTVTPPSTPGLMSLSSGESRLPLNSYYTAQIGRAVSQNSLPAEVMEEMTEDMKIIVEECRVDQARLVLGEVIGQGYFGKVFKGQLLDEHLSTPKTVAVKTTVQGSQCTVQDLTSFLEEAIIMKDFRHHNVLSLMGVVLKDDMPYVILPYMEHGDLKSYIRQPSRRIKVRELLVYGVQVADGMAYLARQKFVHRDLATRNCMVDNSLVVKIADFGLSRDIYKSDYYRIEDKHRPLPVKWMAVESLTAGMFSTKTDVWSFGILMWELLTRGCSPYPDVDTFNIKTYVLSGRRLSKPPHSPDEVYQIMCTCWAERPEERPSFDILYNKIRDIINKQDSEHHPEYLQLVHVD